MEFVNLAERPELFDAAFAIPYAESDGAFMQGNLASLLLRAPRLARCWPEHQLVGLERNDAVVRAVSVPFSTQRDGRVRHPGGGWDQVAIWAAEDANALSPSILVSPIDSPSLCREFCGKAQSVV